MILHEEYQARADRVLGLISGQLEALQQAVDAGFADSTVIIYDLDRLATEFGTPVRFLMHAFTVSGLRQRIADSCGLTADHRLRACLRPALVARPGDDTSHPSDMSHRSESASVGGGS